MLKLWILTWRIVLASERQNIKGGFDNCLPSVTELLLRSSQICLSFRLWFTSLIGFMSSCLHRKSSPDENMKLISLISAPVWRIVNDGGSIANCDSSSISELNGMIPVARNLEMIFAEVPLRCHALIKLLIKIQCIIWVLSRSPGLASVNQDILWSTSNVNALFNGATTTTSNTCNKGHECSESTITPIPVKQSMQW
jgi:hypothetical protein